MGSILIELKGISIECEALLTSINADFVGFALKNKENSDVKWLFAAGNSNEKYKRITVRYGKGIAGKVISTGRPITIHNFPHGIPGKPLDYPVMLAEKLIYAYAVPLFLNGVAKGVLLVGRRTNTPLTDSERVKVNQTANLLENTFIRLV